jgi:hypothetical protein
MSYVLLYSGVVLLSNLGSHKLRYSSGVCFGDVMNIMRTPVLLQAAHTEIRRPKPSQELFNFNHTRTRLDVWVGKEWMV